MRHSSQAKTISIFFTSATVAVGGNIKPRFQIVAPDIAAADATQAGNAVRLLTVVLDLPSSIGTFQN